MTICRVCKSTRTRDVFVITGFPASAQGFSKSKINALDLKSDLMIFECSNCGLTQISNKPIDYYKEVKRAAAYSKDMKLERLKQFKYMEKIINKKKDIFAFEIGAGRGEYMKICEELGWEVLGLEYGNENLKNSNNFINKIIHGFIDDINIHKINSEIPKKIDICYILNFIEHWPKPLESLKRLKYLLNKDTLCLFEVPNFNMIKEKALYAEFIPDHLSYFNLNSFSYLINKAGYEILKLETFYNDYIISCYCKPSYVSEIDHIKKKYFSDKDKLKNSINEIAGAIYFWGAGHQALAYLSMIGNNKKIKFVIDSAPFKQGFYCPGSGYLIKNPDILKNINKGNIIVCCGGYSNEVIVLLREKYNKNFKIYTIENGKVKLVD